MAVDIGPDLLRRALSRAVPVGVEAAAASVAIIAVPALTERMRMSVFPITEPARFEPVSARADAEAAAYTNNDVPARSDTKVASVPIMEGRLFSKAVPAYAVGDAAPVVKTMASVLSGMDDVLVPDGADRALSDTVPRGTDTETAPTDCDSSVPGAVVSLLVTSTSCSFSLIEALLAGFSDVAGVLMSFLSVDLFSLACCNRLLCRFVRVELSERGWASRWCGRKPSGTCDLVVGRLQIVLLTFKRTYAAKTDHFWASNGLDRCVLEESLYFNFSRGHYVTTLAWTDVSGDYPLRNNGLDIISRAYGVPLVRCRPCKDWDWSMCTCGDQGALAYSWHCDYMQIPLSHRSFRIPLTRSTKMSPIERRLYLSGL